MRSTSALRLTAPSSSLLRFLRSQTEDVWLYPANTKSSFCVNDATSGSVKARCRQSIPQPFVPIATIHSPSLTRQIRANPSITRTKYPLVRSSRNVSTQSTEASLAPRCLFAVLYKSGPFSTKCFIRHASTGTRPFFRRLWERRMKRMPPVTLEPDDLPPLGGFLDEGADSSIFNLGRGLPGKSANEPKMRCTEFDENGNVTLVNGEFKKSELIAKYGLLPRDLRKIDSSRLPHILVRPSAILVNLLHLRALIKHDRVLVFDAYGSTDSYTQSVFMYDLEGKLRQRDSSRQAGGLPYELRALEAVLISVTTALEVEYQGVRDPVVRVLRELEEDIDREKLRHLLVYSKKLGTFEQKAKLVRDAIDELLEADDDLAAMYLTAKAKGEERTEEDHTEVEMLLESYHKICDEIVQNSGNLVNNIRNTEEIVRAILDANRNSLMLLDLKFSIGTLGMGSGAFIAALYGMNLKNFIEESDFGFVGVSLWSFSLAVIICAYGLHKLRKIQKVSMFGQGGGGGRKDHWRTVGGPGRTNPAVYGTNGNGGRVRTMQDSEQMRILREVKEYTRSGIPALRK